MLDFGKIGGRKIKLSFYSNCLYLLPISDHKFLYASSRPAVLALRFFDSLQPAAFGNSVVGKLSWA